MERKRHPGPALPRHKGISDGRGDWRRGAAWLSAQYDHLEPVVASFDHEVVPLEHAHQHAPQWSLKGVHDAAAFRGPAVAQRIMLTKCCENLDDGNAICV